MSIDATSPKAWGDAISAARARWGCDVEEAVALIGALIIAQDSSGFAERFGTACVEDVQSILRKLLPPQI